MCQQGVALGREDTYSILGSPVQCLKPSRVCVPAEAPRLMVAPTLNAVLHHFLPAGDMPQSSLGWAGNLLSSKS